MKHTTPNISSIERFWRAANYVSAGMLYLTDNVLLRQPRNQHHFKKFIVGHWGASPGVNVVYAHVSNLIRRTKQPMRLIVGSGHAGPAVLANLYLEGTLALYDRRYSLNEEGLKNLFVNFGNAEGWDTEISPEYPGMMHMGGELGAALAFSQGCAFNSPNSFTVCLVGDGELETSITQASWQGFKFLDRNIDGVVLPVINANGDKMGSTSLLSLLDRQELVRLFKGHGLTPIFAGTDHKETARVFFTAFQMLRNAERREGVQEQPIIILDTPKGWTAPDFFGPQPFAGTHRSHKPILRRPSIDIEQAEMVWSWLQSYDPIDLFDKDGRPYPEVTSCLPSPDLRLGQSHRFVESARSNEETTTVRIEQLNPSERLNNAEAVARMISMVLTNRDDLLIFCPDELSSNQMDVLLNPSGMKFGKRTDGLNQMGPSGKVVEILNEHLCLEWSLGHTQTGRRSILVSYEGFAPIFDSLVAQHLKFLDRSSPTWRPSNPSLNIVLTSLGWRNCATHHNPGFVDGLVGRRLEKLRVYTPIDRETIRLCLETMLNSVGLLNVMVISKHELTKVERCSTERGSTTFEPWRILEASSKEVPQISLVGVGDAMVEECLHAKDIIAEGNQSLSIQVIAVQELSVFDRSQRETDGLINAVEESASTVWAYNGYPKTIEAYLWNLSPKGRHIVLGYRDRASSMAGIARFAENGASRYDIALAAVSVEVDLNDFSPTVAKCKTELDKLLNLKKG